MLSAYTWCVGPTHYHPFLNSSKSPIILFSVNLPIHYTVQTIALTELIFNSTLRHTPMSHVFLFSVRLLKHDSAHLYMCVLAVQGVSTSCMPPFTPLFSQSSVNFALSVGDILVLIVCVCVCVCVCYRSSGHYRYSAKVYQQTALDIRNKIKVEISLKALSLRVMMQCIF